MNNTARPHLLGLLAGLFLSAGLIASAMLVTRAWLHIAESQTVSVTGSARRAVRSDLVLWRGSFWVEANALLAAHRARQIDLGKVEAFLNAQGVTNYAVAPIVIQELRAREKAVEEANQPRTVGYRLIQTVEVRASDVDRVARLERDSAALVEQGVVFGSNPPEYIYTKAGEAKVEMLAEATADARARAEQIATQGGRAIAQLRSARMGVFQITPVHSAQTSSEGINDTTSLDKTITAVVTASFSLQ
jgi:hypothetical protein